MATQDNHGKMARLITNKELADLSDEWLNPKVDTRKYYQTCLTVYEIDEETFNEVKEEGICCQVVKPSRRNGNTVDRYYVGW